MITLDIGTVVVPLGRNAKYGHLDVNSELFNTTVTEYIYQYGLRQVLNDAMADKKDDDGEELSSEAIRAKALKRLDTLYAGTLRTRMQGDTEPLDPFEAELFRLIRQEFVGNLRDKGALKGLPKGTKDQALFVINRDRAKLGKGELGWADLVHAFAPSKRGKELAKLAEDNLAKRGKADDDLMAAAGM